MKKELHVAAILIEPPKITERYSARIKTECGCGAVLVTTLERSTGGILTTSISTVCPDCQADHQRLISPVAEMLDAAKQQNERLAILN